MDGPLLLDTLARSPLRLRKKMTCLGRTYTEGRKKQALKTGERYRTIKIPCYALAMRTKGEQQGMIRARSNCDVLHIFSTLNLAPYSLAVIPLYFAS
jgi:hypothetical protein